MKKCITQIPGRPASTLPFSSGVIAEGKFLFVSGQGPSNPDGPGFIRGSIGEQTRLTLESVKRIVEAGGATMADVVSCRVFLQPLNAETFAEMNAAYALFFPSDKPVRTTVGCTLLNIDVEIDCIVAMP